MATGLNMRRIMRDSKSGFTLVEIMVTAGLISVIALAAAQMRIVSIRSSQSTAASDDCSFL